MRLLVPLIVAGLFIPSVTCELSAQVDAPPSVALPAELDRVLRDYEQAWSARDPAAVAALFHDDGFALPSGKPPAHGRHAIQDVYATAGGDLRLRALAFATEGRTGWIIGAYGFGDTQGDVGKFVLALVRDPSGKWLIAGDIDNANQRP